MKTKKEYNDPYYRTSSQSPKINNESAVNSELNTDTSFVDIGQRAISTAEKTTIEPQRFEPRKVSAKVKKLMYPSSKLNYFEILKHANSNNSISEMYDMLGAYNLVGKIGVWMMLVGSTLITLGILGISGIIFFEDSGSGQKYPDLGTFIIFFFSILIGLGLLVLGFILWGIGLAIFHWF
jgi:hypothetical protein